MAPYVVAAQDARGALIQFRFVFVAAAVTAADHGEEEKEGVRRARV